MAVCYGVFVLFIVRYQILLKTGKHYIRSDNKKQALRFTEMFQRYLKVNHKSYNIEVNTFIVLFCSVHILGKVFLCT